MEKNVNGLVSQMNRINVTVNAYRLLAIIAIAVAGLVSIGCVYLYTQQVSTMSDRIYVLDQGRSFTAVSQEGSVFREDEVRDQVRTFHELMFNLPPNREMIVRNLERAFDMCDKSAYNYYNDLQERGFYKRLTGTNSYQQIVIDSIEIDMESYPYKVVVKGYQYINRESNISQYTFASRCRVVNAVRNANNLHGLMLENFEVVENSFVETRNK